MGWGGVGNTCFSGGTKGESVVANKVSKGTEEN